MTLAREELQTVYDDEVGTTHAIYPTAATTLCGVPRERVVASRVSHAPACGPCAQTARTFRRIDNSTPAHWHFDLDREPAPNERSL